MAKKPSEPNCREIVDLLAEYLDGSLEPATARRLRSHLEGCAPCVAFVNTYKGTVKAARRLKETDIPPELKDRLLSFLRERKIP
ncbi:MAG: zf-HC2 domain-containing protein [Candidatus Rokubacteria bacterium]|nr:zf-HC2 domain-containing protein [Candidatus Rokubacteria bacterium]